MKNVGLVLSHNTPKDTIDAIISADKMGVETVWSISRAMDPDLLTYYAAAAVKTKQINFGTSIIPILPRHPIVLVSQIVVLENLAPGRVRLGIGPSHKYSMENMLGLDFEHPQKKLHEYVTVLRQALWEGKIDFSGDYYNIHQVSLPSSIKIPKTPILIAALREKAFELAGEIADGAISWMCPIDYLEKVAKPAMQKGAKRKKRKTPILITHVPIAFSINQEKVIKAAQERLGRYAKMPYYASMFSDAGFPVGDKGELSDEMINNFVVFGTPAEIRKKLEDIFHKGTDEILLLPVAIEDQFREEKEIMKLIGS